MRLRFLAVIGAALIGAFAMTDLQALLRKETLTQTERNQLADEMQRVQLMASDASAILQGSMAVFPETIQAKNGMIMNTTGSSNTKFATGIHMLNREATPYKGYVLFRFINSAPVMAVGTRDPTDGTTVHQLYIYSDGIENVVRGIVAFNIVDDDTDFAYKFFTPSGGSDSRVTFDTKVNFTAGAQLTIATGVITATKAWHDVDTQDDDATDDLDTINGGTTGDILVLQAENSARTVVCKDGTGNLALAGDFSMDNVEDKIVLLFDGSNWTELSRSNNGA